MESLHPNVTVSDWCGIGPTRYGIPPQTGPESVVLNVFTHPTGLEVGVFFNVSEPEVGDYTGEYVGELSAFTLPKISPTPAGKAVEKAVRFRLVPDFTEPPNDLPLEAGHSPRCPDSAPFPNWQDTSSFQTNSTGEWFRQINPLGIRHTFSIGTNDILQVPRFTHTLGAPDPIRQVDPQLFARAVESALSVSFNAQ